VVVGHLWAASVPRRHSPNRVSTAGFITADYTFGQVLEAQAGEIAARRQSLGSRAPFNTADFSSFPLQAKASNAKVVALANAGGDARPRSSRRTWASRGGQKLAALFLNITDVHALGLDTAQGLVIFTSFYWDRTDASRASKRSSTAPRTRRPSCRPAFPAPRTHYLKAIKEAGTDATGPVAAQMKKMKINDPMTENGWIREDGRVMRDFYVVQVKTPAESKAPWDYYTVVGKVAAEDAALPLSRSTCKLVQK
jgi:branched-chain amino acid transport system substrate-binding protein